MALFLFFPSSWRCLPTKHPRSLFFFFFFLIWFLNCYTMNTSYYLSFILPIHHFFCVFFTSCLEVFVTKHPLFLLFFFIILIKKWSKEKKISKKKGKKKEEEKIRGVHQQTSSFSVFLHYNEYLLFTFFSSSYSSYFLFISTSCLEVS